MLVLLQFIGAVALLILVHELGHFFAAKAMGIKVDELGIGFPPRMVKLFTAGETEVTLNWIPLGGFIRAA
ncbi:MAG: site-2 protease family protein, partial [Thiotrichales bacterium]|nr:site-2 protease family protein [Thiotrichales bacterium]